MEGGFFHRQLRSWLVFGCTLWVRDIPVGSTLSVSKQWGFLSTPHAQTHARTHARARARTHAHTLFLCSIAVLKRQTKSTISFDKGYNFFCNPILFAICTNTFSKICKKTCIQWHVEVCSLALLCN
jgi:hypothetical protein